MLKRVVITGAGVISSLADSPEGLHEALCQGRCGLGPIDLFETDQIGGQVRDFDATVYLGEGNLRPLDRIAQLSASAAHLALADSECTPQMREKQDVGMVLGTVFSSVHTIGTFDRTAITRGPRFVKPLDFANTVINAAAGQTAIWHNLRGINSTLATGGSSGLQALCYAADLIQRGRAPMLLAGGAEELCFEMLFGFEQAGGLCNNVAEAVPFDVRRKGFAVGEGAAFLVLEDADEARARAACVVGEICGYGHAFDPSRGQDAEKMQQAMTGAIQGALSHAGVTAEQVNCISASASGSVVADRCEAQAIEHTFKACVKTLPVTAAKGALGETLGASGAIQTVALLAAMQAGVLPGIRGLETCESLLCVQGENIHKNMEIGLVLSFGFDGNMCALVLSKSPGKCT